MSNGIEIFARGKNFGIKGQALDITAATGVFADNALTQQVFNGRVQSHNMGIEIESENISPTDCFYSNGVAIEQAFRFTVSEHKTLYALGASGNSRLEALVLASYYVRFLFELYSDANAARSGSTGFLRRCIVYARFTGWNEEVPKGQTIQSANFESVALADGSGGWKVNPYFTSTSATVDIP